MKLIKIIINFWVLTLVSIGSSYAEDKGLTVGSTNIVIPKISNYENDDSGLYTKLNPNVKSIDYQPKLKSEMLHGRGIIIFTPKALAYKNISESDFLAISSALKLQHEKLLKKSYEKGKKRIGIMSEEIKDMYMDISKMKLSEPTSLGVFLENNKAIGVVSLSKISGHINNVEVFQKIAIGQVIMLIKGKMLTLEIHTSFKSLDDLNWLKRKAKLISSKIIKANQTSLF
jgi:hypothetical protein